GRPSLARTGAHSTLRPRPRGSFPTAPRAIATSTQWAPIRAGRARAGRSTSSSPTARTTPCTCGSRNSAGCRAFEEKPCRRESGGARVLRLLAAKRVVLEERELPAVERIAERRVVVGPRELRPELLGDGRTEGI